MFPLQDTLFIVLPSQNHKRIPGRQLCHWMGKCYKAEVEAPHQTFTFKYQKLQQTLTPYLHRVNQVNNSIVQVTRLKMFTAGKQEFGLSTACFVSQLTTTVLVVPCLFVTKETLSEKQVTNCPPSEQQLAICVNMKSICVKFRKLGTGKSSTTGPLRCLSPELRCP